jgi:hypothetical protein
MQTPLQKNVTRDPTADATSQHCKPWANKNKQQIRTQVQAQDQNPANKAQLQAQDRNPAKSNQATINNIQRRKKQATTTPPGTMLFQSDCKTQTCKLQQHEQASKNNNNMQIRNQCHAKNKHGPVNQQCHGAYKF